MSNESTSWDIPPATGTTAAASRLPEIISIEDFFKAELEIPKELVEGLIHQTTLNMFAGGSKSWKSFTLLDLGLSVSQGMPWWGRTVVGGRVLYVNLEISPAFLKRRLRDLADEKDLLIDAENKPVSLSNFDLWNLRGHAADVKQLMPKIIERCRDEDYAMIIIDPIYKLIGGRNENDAGQMAEVLNEFDALANETGAAVVYSHHFAKGLAAAKEQLDRASGSGVFARHADAIITLTPHEEEGAVVVEATLRNMRAPQPFVMRWSYPLMRVASDLDPKKFKSKPGAKTKYSVADVIACLVDGMTTGQWEGAVVKQTGMARSTFDVWKRRAVELKRVEEKDGKWSRRPMIHVLDPATGESHTRYKCEDSPESTQPEAKVG